MSYQPHSFTTKTMHLWPDDSPENQPTSESPRPKIDITIPQDLTKPAPVVLICPGGGYNHLSEDKEGYYWARELARRGYVAAVLFYRHKPHFYPAPFADATRAVRLLKSQAQQLNINPNKVIIMGFSAGGHLASTVATIPDHYTCPNDNLAHSFSANVHGVVLGYPVITLGPKGHMGSKFALLGQSPNPQLVNKLSNHNNVTESTPPAFLFHTAEDKAVPVENSLMFAQACHQHNVPAELHIFAHGPHGLGAAANQPGANQWPQLLFNWLERQK